MVVRQRGGDQGCPDMNQGNLDPAFELSGVLMVLRLSADCHWKKVWVEVVSQTHTVLLLKIIGSSLTGN